MFLQSKYFADFNDCDPFFFCFSAAAIVLGVAEAALLNATLVRPNNAIYTCERVWGHGRGPPKDPSPLSHTYIPNSQ